MLYIYPLMCVGRCGSISRAASMFQGTMWSFPEAMLTDCLSRGYLCMCAVQRCRKQEDAVFLLHSTQGNTPHNCCQISAKLNNSIIPHSCGGLYLCVCNNQISVEARRVVLSETLSSSTARRLFSLKTILLIKRGVTVERGSEEHRLLVQLFVPC